MYKKSSPLKTNSAILATLIISFWLSACSEENIVTATPAIVKATPAPTINNVEGNITTDTSITISGVGFTNKLNAKPLFWWDADDSYGQTGGGTLPNPELGRKSTWDSKVGGNMSSVKAPTNGTYSVRYAHGDYTENNSGSDPILGSVRFASESMYMFRKVYEDYHVNNDYAVRAWIDHTTIVGTGFVVGDIVTDNGTGATGTISQVSDQGTSPVIVSFDGGTVYTGVLANDADFTQLGTVTSSNGTTATSIYNNPKGVQRTFNQKIVRIWTDDLSNDGIVLTQHHEAGGSHYQNIEGSDPSTRWKEQWQNILYQPSKVWTVEEFEYKNSSAEGAADGVFRYWQDGVVGYTSDDMIWKDSSHPEDMTTVVNHQVSNGAQLGSYTYISQLYIDDTAHRVIISDKSTWDEDSASNIEVQIPTTWSTNEITVKLNLGALDPSVTPLFLYVINKYGLANLEGQPLQP